MQTTPTATLLLVGERHADWSLARHLQGLGLDVRTARPADVSLAQEAAAGTALVVIAPSCELATSRPTIGSNTILPTLPLPALVLAGGAWERLGMASAVQAAVSPWAHQLGHGEPFGPPGRLPLFAAPSAMWYGVPPRGAQVTLTTDRAPSLQRAVAFHIEAGGALVPAGAAATHRMAGLGLGPHGVERLSADGHALLGAAVRWCLGGTRASSSASSEGAATEAAVGMLAVLDQQGRRQAATLMTLEAVHDVAGAELSREYRAAARAEHRRRRERRGSGAEQRPPSPPSPAPSAGPSDACPHCGALGGRPAHGGFGAQLDEQPELTQAELRAARREYVARALSPWASSGVSLADVEAAAALRPDEWNVRYQVVSGRLYAVGGEPPPVNHHHRKRMLGVRQLLAQLLREGSDGGGGGGDDGGSCDGDGDGDGDDSGRGDGDGDGEARGLPDIDFVINFSDSPKALPMPPDAPAALRATAGAPPPTDTRLGGLRTPEACGDFGYEELEHTEPGPFGQTSGAENLLFRGSGFQASAATAAAAAAAEEETSPEAGGGGGGGGGGRRAGRPPPPIFSAAACCFAADISFPTAWYDFASSDGDWRRLAAEAREAAPWRLKRDRAFFRGSVYWYRGHGRLRAFAQSLVAPQDVDADWYDQIETSALETDGANIFGNVSEAAAYKALLSLEGHSWWSFRLRHLLHMDSAVLHQHLPCHEFWHAALRPYEHYVPLRRDLSDLQAQLRYVRGHDAAAARMARRAQRLAFKLLSQRAVAAYAREVLVAYARLQTFDVALHPDAVPVPLHS